MCHTGLWRWDFSTGGPAFDTSDMTRFFFSCSVFFFFYTSNPLCFFSLCKPALSKTSPTNPFCSLTKQAEIKQDEKKKTRLKRGTTRILAGRTEADMDGERIFTTCLMSRHSSCLTHFSCGFSRQLVARQKKLGIKIGQPVCRPSSSDFLRQKKGK